ncbi:hypothetical protein AB8881_06345 [Alphaproteobacteria bacterium LSUCC0396]
MASTPLNIRYWALSGRYAMIQISGVVQISGVTKMGVIKMGVIKMGGAKMTGQPENMGMK